MLFLLSSSTNDIQIKIFHKMLSFSILLFDRVGKNNFNQLWLWLWQQLYFLSWNLVIFRWFFSLFIIQNCFSDIKRHHDKRKELRRLFFDSVLKMCHVTIIISKSFVQMSLLCVTSSLEQMGLLESLYSLDAFILSLASQLSYSYLQK